jgi:ferritin-like metal-binding protein YciE
MKMNSLSNLLAHEIVDLYSAEEQIIEALPKMIESAQNQDLKKALKEHLKITEQQKKRLEKVHKQLQQEDGSSEESLGESECLGMKGLIEEGQKIMSEDMEPDVMDAAIIAAAQKIEHYEISSYGTACAYARELGLGQIEKQLRQTLDEEYYADDLLTDMAVGSVNDEAEGEEEIDVRKLPASRGRSNSSSNGRSTSQKSSSRSTASKSAAGRSSNGSSKRGASRSTGRTKKSASSGRSKSTTSKSKNSGSRSRGKSSRSR